MLKQHLENNKKLVLLTALICCVMPLIFDFANPILIFSRNEFHYWQLLTAHFVHYDMKHLVLNILALFLSFYIFQCKKSDLVKGFALAMIMIDVYLFAFEVTYYTGFSGLLYVMPGLAWMNFIFKKKYTFSFLILVVYLLYIYSSSSLVFISAEVIWHPLYQAHLLGFTSGIIISIANYSFFDE